VELDSLYNWCLWILLGLSAVTFPFLFFVTMPYGRHMKDDRAPKMKALPGWLIMEAPAPIIFPIIFAQGANASQLVPIIFLGIWECHYFYRSFLFPLRMRDRGKLKPVAAVAVGFLFNTVNGFLNAYAITELAPHLYETNWLWDPRFLVGIALMIIGVSTNIHSDTILRNLRKPGETGYKIPYGGFYRWVSSPNYLGEITEWVGFALATWTTAGLAFALFSFANLFPRAIAHHRWYHDKFEDYPEDRKAIIPKIV
jgi:protein-S-isoprenylcysteine O-methyltransferase Ste14